MHEPIDVVEALLFASDAPLEAERIREVLELGDVGEAQSLVAELRARYEAAGRALQIVEVGGGYRMVTRSEVAPWLMRLARSRSRARLSRPALETLAIIAYRRSVSRPEVDAIRGVNSEGVLESLMERRLVRIAGRKDAPGRPFLYEPTREFLVAFGLRDLDDLPKVDGELQVPDALAAEQAAPEQTGEEQMTGAEEAVAALDGAREAGEPAIALDGRDVGEPVDALVLDGAPVEDEAVVLAVAGDEAQIEQGSGASGDHVAARG
jgi:segregation and condensation protein B